MRSRFVEDKKECATNRGMPAVSPMMVQPCDEANHRIANSLQLLSAMLSIEARSVSDDGARQVLEIARQRVVAIAGVHRHLYRASQDRWVDVAEYLRELACGLEEGCGSGAYHRPINVSAVSAVVPAEVAVSLGLIVTELVVNACKHAYSLDEPGRIDIRVFGGEGETSRLEVRDYGVGPVDIETPIRRGLGSTILEATARQLGATLSRIDCERGTRFVLTGRFLQFDEERADPDKWAGIDRAA